MAPGGALPHRDSAPWKQAKLSDSGMPCALSWMFHATFAQIAQLSWPYLDEKTKKSVRLSSSSGRLVADQLRDSLYVSDKAWSSQPNALENAVVGMLGRGARLKELELMSLLAGYGRRGLTSAAVHDRMLSFLAALAAPAAPDAACPPQPINRLALRCYLPLSAAVAEALLAACPRVSDLTIITFDEEDVHSAAYGIMQLLSGYGPQLQLLHLRPRPLPPLALYSLSACTGLVRLELAHNEFPASGVLAGELSALRAVSRLRSLQHLQLQVSNADIFKQLPVTAHTLAEHRRHATALQQLSCLTALTHLELSLPHHCRGDTECSTLVQLQRQGPEVLRSLRTVWNTQQASLMAALRCMPQLQHLDLSFHLPASEVSTLAALTHLEVAGLLGPTASSAAAAAPVPAGARVSLPPQLQTMQLPYGCVRTLAAVQPPETLKAVTGPYKSSHNLSFSVWDMSPDGKRLLPAAVRAVRGAVKLLAREREGGSESSAAGPFNGRTLSVGPLGYDVAPIEPPVEQEDHEGQGHAAWIGKLRRLNRHNVTFSGFALQPADLLCIARTLDMIRVLDLRGCSFLLSALPSLAALPHMRELRFAVNRCTGASAAQLESALLLTAVFAGALRKLAAHSWDVPTTAAMIRQKVQVGLRQHGAEGVRVLVLGPDEDSDDEREEEEEEEGEGQTEEEEDWWEGEGEEEGQMEEDEEEVQG